MEDVVTRSITIVDEAGLPVMQISGTAGLPSIELLRHGSTSMRLSVDHAGYPSVSLSNPTGAATASLAVDDKGAHVKFYRPDGGSSYLFLDNEGTSGIVLVDGAGKRRYATIVDASGNLTKTPDVADGK